MPRIDPRLREILPTVNDKLRDHLIRHAFFLERYKGHNVAEILKLLDKHVFRDVTRQIRRFLERIDLGRRVGLSGLARLSELMESIDQTIKVGYRLTRDGLKQELFDFAKHEANWQAGSLKRHIPIAVTFNTPSVGLLNAIVTSKPFEHRLLREHFNDLAFEYREKLKMAVKVGLVEGESIPKITKRVRAATNLGKHHAETIGRTAVAHVQNQSRIATYKGNEDVVSGWQFIAVLDSRTTEICMFQDGMTYPLSDDTYFPPLHLRCRSTHGPVTKSWEELGIPGLKELSPGTRAARGISGMSGKVPETLDYLSWLKRQPIAFQNKALGVGKAKLFREGKLPIGEKGYFDKDFRPMTLKEIMESDI